MVYLPNLEQVPPADVLRWAISTFGDRFAIATSFQKEGMVIVDLARSIAQDIRVFTLDTGRLPQETYSIIDTVRERYGIAVEIVFPESHDVEQLVTLHGANLFYESPEKRHLCCEVRKVRPLARKLAELDAWATGLRREQSQTRENVPVVERVDGRVKLNPLAAWTGEEVDGYIRENNVPVHPLYARGYTSIGCAPCTRALEPGETDPRAGRWWWERDGKRECGIHFSPEGVVSRA